MNRPWWLDAVVYQIYVRSFADANGDGIGDLAGIRSRLDHIASLGADAIWLTPCYPSPQMDHGYDVADYVSIEPDYGDLDEFDRLVAAAHARDLRVMLDVVPNHCSSEHAWFRAAVAAGPGSPERERYFFRDGRGEHGELPPNNWRALFGGPAWTRVTEPDGSPGQWYLHVFTPWQPDFDWSSPDVVQMFDDVLRFWFDRGVDGFRVDAVTVLGKAPGLPDAPEGEPRTYFEFWPSGHDVWRHWRQQIDRYELDHPGRVLVTVGEAYAARRPDLLATYVAPDQFHQSFSFDLLMTPWHAGLIHRAVDDTWRVLSESGGSMTWTLNNHDVQRIVTRLGHEDAHLAEIWTGDNQQWSQAPVDLELGERRARAAIGFTVALPGALYLYQGEELGLPEVLDVPDEARTDPIFFRTQGAQAGRDGCRIPIPWTTDPSTAYGFSAGGDENDRTSSPPWLPQPDGWGQWAVERQDADPGSMLTMYRELLARRRTLLDPSSGLEWVRVDGGALLVFRRGEVVVVLNTSGTTQPLPAESTDGRRVAWSSQSSQSAHDDATSVPADTCVWLAPAERA